METCSPSLFMSMVCFHWVITYSTSKGAKGVHIGLIRFTDNRGLPVSPHALLGCAHRGFTTPKTSVTADTCNRPQLCLRSRTQRIYTPGMPSWFKVQREENLVKQIKINKAALINSW